MSGVPRHGGAREGAGAPRGPREPKSEEREDYDHWRARNERAKALRGEFDLEVEQGKYLPTDVIASAAATAVATFVQACRGIGDELERAAGIPPEHAQMVQDRIDAALAELSADMQKLAEMGKPVGGTG